MQNIIGKFSPIGKFQNISKDFMQIVIGKFTPIGKFQEILKEFR